MKKTLIDGQPCILGDCNFIKESFLGLSPGEKVSQIGNGKNTGCYKTLRLKSYMTYTGSIVIDNEKRFAFEIRPEEIEGWSLFNQPKKVYLLFIECAGDVGKENWKENRVDVYKALFWRRVNNGK